MPLAPDLEPKCGLYLIMIWSSINKRYVVCNHNIPKPLMNIWSCGNNFLGTQIYHDEQIIKVQAIEVVLFLFDLILYVPSTIFQL